MTEADVLDQFKEIAAVTGKVQIIRDKGYAYVEFKDRHVCGDMMRMWKGKQVPNIDRVATFNLKWAAQKVLQKIGVPFEGATQEEISHKNTMQFEQAVDASETQPASKEPTEFKVRKRLEVHLGKRPRPDGKTETSLVTPVKEKRQKTGSQEQTPQNIASLNAIGIKLLADIESLVNETNAQNQILAEKQEQKAQEQRNNLTVTMSKIVNDMDEVNEELRRKLAGSSSAKQEHGINSQPIVLAKDEQDVLPFEPQQEMENGDELKSLTDEV